MHLLFEFNLSLYGGCAMTDRLLIDRELLEELRDAANDGMNATTRQHQIDYFAGLIAQADALLSAPSPAGVDGLEVVAWRIGFPNNAGYKVYEQRQPWAYEQYGVPSVIVYEVQELCRLSAAQSIIDGLRGENERIRLNIAEYNEAISCYQSERDQQAQRIGELEGLLLRVQVSLSLDDTEWGYSGAEKYKLLADIRAALSAGKEGE